MLKTLQYRRAIKPDARYNSVLLSKFINNVMRDGKKNVAEELVYKALGRIEEKHGKDPLKTFNDSLENVKPFVEVSTMRVGGASYQVPSPIDERRGYTLATRWIINAVHKRTGKRGMAEKLAEEIYESANRRGTAFRKRVDSQKTAEANRAYAHFAHK